MLGDDEFKTRLKLLARSHSIFEKWKEVNDELIKGTFPFLKKRERTLLDCIIRTIWDIGFNDALYVEVILRLRRKEKELFPSKKTIDKTIQKLCKSGIVNSEISKFRPSNPDGTPGPWKKERVLKLPESFREEALNGMAEVFKMTMDGYFSPQRK